jgi:hypothetical protein|tara:strand:- start:72 stop:197 length:126 start_codon:yes stop_codon:yes gene_type:complete
MPSVETTMAKRIETPGAKNHPVFATQCPMAIGVVELAEGPP